MNWIYYDKCLEFICINEKKKSMLIVIGMGIKRTIITHRENNDYSPVHWIEVLTPFYMCKSKYENIQVKIINDNYLLKFLMTMYTSAILHMSLSTFLIGRKYYPMKVFVVMSIFLHFIISVYIFVPLSVWFWN